MLCKPLHLIAFLLASLGVASLLRAADPLPPEGTAPIAPASPNGPFEITWVMPRAVSRGDGGGVSFSGDGKRLLVAWEGVAQVWDTRTWKTAGPQIELGDRSMRVKLTSDGKRLIIARDLGKSPDAPDHIDIDWRLWNVETGKPLGPASRTKNREKEKGRRVWTAGLLISTHDGRLVATSPDGKTVSVFKAETGEKVHAFAHEISIQDMEFDEEGKTLVVIDWHDKAHLWDIKTGRKAATHNGFDDPRSFQSGRVLSDFFFGFRVLDAATGKVLLSHDDYDKYALGEMIMSPGGNRVAIEAYDQCEIWDVDAGRKIVTVPANGPVLMDPKGTVLLVNHWTGRRGDDAFVAGMWDAETGNKVRGLGDFIADAAFSPDGNLLAIVNERMWVIHADPTKKGAERWKVDKGAEEKE